MNESPHLPVVPTELLEMTHDPRLADMKELYPGAPHTIRELKPQNPPVAGESPFVLLADVHTDRFVSLEWLNKPTGAWRGRTGGGAGFSGLEGAPVFRESGRAPRRPSDAWVYLAWLIASPEFAGMLRKVDPSAMESREIDWTLSDGTKLPGYSFLDIRRRIPAYDYSRSAVHFELDKGTKRFLRLVWPRALKRDISPAVHVFREEFIRSDIFFSRALARAAMDAGLSGMEFRDPATGEPLT
jgi:hypothetical protein